MSYYLTGPAKPGRGKLASRTEAMVGSGAATPTQEAGSRPREFNGVTIFINCGERGKLERSACTDTGAEANFVDDEVVKSAYLVSQPIDGSFNCQLGDGREFTPVGWLDMEFTVGGRPYKTYKEKFYVVKGAPYDALLGVTFCKENIYTRDPNIWTHFLQQSKDSRVRSEERQAERDATDRQDVNNERRYFQDTNNRERKRLANISSEVPDGFALYQPGQSIPQAESQAYHQPNTNQSQAMGYGESSNAAQLTSNWEWDGEQGRWRYYDYVLKEWIWGQLP